MTTVRTSNLNVAMVGVLNHSEFIATDPLRDPFTGKFHANAKSAADYMGFHSLAHVIQAGICHFDLGASRGISLHKYNNGKKGVSNDVDDENSGSEDAGDEIGFSSTGTNSTLMATIAGLVKNHEIPTVESLHNFLRKDFLSLKDGDFQFFQSVLQDLWILQPWTRPLNFKEEHQLASLYHPHEENMEKSRDGADTTAEDDFENNFSFETGPTVQSSSLSCFSNQTAGQKRIVNAQRNSTTEARNKGHSTPTTTPAQRSSSSSSQKNSHDHDPAQRSSSSSSSSSQKNSHDHDNHSSKGIFALMFD